MVEQFCLCSPATSYLRESNYATHPPFECLSLTDNRQRKLRSAWECGSLLPPLQGEACLAAFSTSNFSAELVNL